MLPLCYVILLFQNWRKQFRSRLSRAQKDPGLSVPLSDIGQGDGYPFSLILSEPHILQVSFYNVQNSSRFASENYQ